MATPSSSSMGWFRATYLNTHAAPPPSLQRHSVAIPDQAFTDTTYLVSILEAAAAESHRRLTGVVNVAAYRDPAMMVTKLTVAEVPPSHGFDIRDTVRLVAAIGEALGLDPAVTATIRRPDRFATSATSASTNPLTHRYLQSAWSKMAAAAPQQNFSTVYRQAATTNVTASVTTSSYGQPEPPPAPEPFWSPTPVYGFRAWSVADGSGGWGTVPYMPGTLVGRVIPWLSARHEAECRDTTLSFSAIEAGHAPEGHDAPNWGCHCGVYVCDDPNHTSVKAIDRLIPPYYNAFGATYLHAIGVVELTGTIIQHEHGSRGAVGEIRHLWVLEKVAEQVNARYQDVPVTAVATQPVNTWSTYDEIDADAKRRAVLHAELYAKKEELEEPWLK